MRSALSLALGSLAVVSMAGAAPALETPGPSPGHSTHGEAFNEGPRQAAYLMGNTGDIHFPISTASKEAQSFFNQGIGQLHGFWSLEAERSFRQVAALEPTSAMAYWGMAMANMQNAKRARTFVAKATALKANCSEREQMWVDSLVAYFDESVKEDKARKKNCLDKLSKLVETQPDDLEAKAFLAYMIWKDGRTADFKGPELDKLILEITSKNPRHPVHHYRIHHWDYKNAKQALDSAAACGPAAADIAHMWHMPGHIYSQLHRYADAAWQQEASARVDHTHQIRSHLLPDQIHNYAHNNEWLIRNLAFTGRAHDAVDLAKNMIELPRITEKRRQTFAISPTNYFPITNGPIHISKTSSYAYGRTRLLDLLIRFELWEELSTLSKTPYLTPDDDADERIRIIKSVGLAELEMGNHTQVREHYQRLSLLLAAYRSATNTLATNSPTKNPPATNSPATNSPSTNAPAKPVSPPAASKNVIEQRVKNIEAALAEIRLRQSLRNGDTNKAKIELAQTRDLGKEELSRIHLALGDAIQAERLALEAVKGATNQVRPIANYAHILSAAGKTPQALETMKTVRELAGQADLDTRALRRLSPLAVQLGWPLDWRLPSPALKDIGERPPLASLGPFRWHPIAAPDWSLTDSNGRRVTLSGQRGRPIIVIFYLGAGCVHCIEQLNQFAPANEQFKKLGVSLIAISTETVANLRQTLSKSSSAKGFPFPIASDASLQTFKAYRAYDDFEHLPLHGTFLIDGAGLLRWQDISYEPFNDIPFLLAETRRLLATPVARNK